MTTGDLQRLINYRDNLLIYIHDHIGLETHSQKELISLVQEHKRITQFINSF